MSDLITWQQACQEMGITLKGINQLIDEGKLIPVAMNNNLYYSRELLRHHKQVAAMIMKNTRSVTEKGY